MMAFAAAALAQQVTLSAPGAPADVQARLRTASSVIAARARGRDSPQELLAAALADYRALIQVLYDAGYFGPEIEIRLDGREAARIPPLDPPRTVGRIEIAIDPGPEFRLGRARVAPLAPGTVLPDGFTPGAPATTGLIRDAAQAGIVGWRRAGHAKAQIDAQRIVVDHRRAVLDAEITLLPGPRLRFGALTARGNTAVRPDAVARIAGFPTGALFDPDAVQKVAGRLRRAGAFSSVSIREAARANPDGTLDFEAALTERPPRRISLGAEISTREGLDLSAIWLHRNLFGAAERLRVEARLRNLGGTEDVDGMIALRLDRPASLGPDDNLFYLAEAERLDEPNFNLSRMLAGAGVRRVYSDDLSAELALTGSRAKADDAFGTARRFNLLALPLRVELDRRDNALNPARGGFLEARLTPFAGLSDSRSGLSVALDGRGYLSLARSESVVLAGRVQLGAVLGAGLAQISPEYLFYSGGAGTVRGQPYQSLGVAVGTATAGGRSLLAGSAEIRGRIGGKFSLVGFYDFGAVDAGVFIDDGSARHSGAGLGLRYDLGGLGPLRLDLAVPVSGGTGGGLQFYLGIGQSF